MKTKEEIQKMIDFFEKRKKHCDGLLAEVTQQKIDLLKYILD